MTNTGSQRSETVDFNYIGHFYLESFAARDKRLGRLSARADLLSQRHESLPIKQFSSIADYTSADFFLFLRGKRTGGDALGWKMWSSVYLKEPPNFLIAAESKKIAEEVMALLEFKDIEEFKIIIVRCATEIYNRWEGDWRNPINEKSVAEVGKYP